MSRKKAMLMVLTGVVMVSYSGPLVRAALNEGAAPVSVAMIRMAITALFMLPEALRGKASLQNVKMSRASFVQLLCAAACLALHYTFWMTSLGQTSTFASVALVCTQPLFVALLSYFIYKEKISRAALPGAVLAMAGAGIIAAGGIGDGGSSLLGNMTALLGAVFIAGHWMLAKHLRRTLPTAVYALCVYAATALLLLLITPVTGGFALPGYSFFYTLALSVGCTLLGHALFTRALGTLSASVISFALLFEPVGAMVWAVIFFKEIPTAMLIAGGACVLGGLALYLLAEIKQTAPRR
ncbi:MAG: DMT family transporter [Clostridia bacterium]|nr:DMT family transporter [Clostridia bacterium]